MNKKELIKQLIEKQENFILFDNLEDCLLVIRESDIIENEVIENIIKEYKKGQLILWYDNVMSCGEYYLLDNMAEVFEKINEIDNDFLITLLEDFYNEINKE